MVQPFPAAVCDNAAVWVIEGVVEQQRRTRELGEKQDGRAAEYNFDHDNSVADDFTAMWSCKSLSVEPVS